MFLNLQSMAQQGWHSFDKILHKDSKNPGIKPSTGAQILHWVHLNLSPQFEVFL